MLFLRNTYYSYKVLLQDFLGSPVYLETTSKIFFCSIIFFLFVQKKTDSNGQGWKFFHAWKIFSRFKREKIFKKFLEKIPIVTRKKSIFQKNEFLVWHFSKKFSRFKREKTFKIFQKIFKHFLSENFLALQMGCENVEVQRPLGQSWKG